MHRHSLTLRTPIKSTKEISGTQIWLDSPTVYYREPREAFIGSTSNKVPVPSKLVPGTASNGHRVKNIAVARKEMSRRFTNYQY